MSNAPRSDRPDSSVGGNADRPNGRREASIETRPGPRARGGDTPDDGLVPTGEVRSRSADPGQSSYGGFGGEAGPAQPSYVRSDASLGDGIRDRLATLDVDVGDVSVELSEGRASLHGTVTDEHARQAVEDCVGSVLGVRSVDNQLTLRA